MQTVIPYEEINFDDEKCFSIKYDFSLLNKICLNGSFNASNVNYILNNQMKVNLSSMTNSVVLIRFNMASLGLKVG